MQVSFYVTAKGEVFCWPPYVNEGRAWVNATTSAKYNNAEISELTADNLKDATIEFVSTGEKVKIGTTAINIPVTSTGAAATTCTDGSQVSVAYTDAANAVATGVTFNAGS